MQLRETQRAALGEEMVKIQQNLADFEKDHKGVELRLESLRSDLADLETRNANLADEVARFEEREKILGQIRYWSTAVTFREFQRDHAEWQEARKQFKRLTQEKSRLAEEDEPFQKAVIGLDAEANAAAAQVKETRRKYNNTMIEIGNLANMRAQLGDDTENAKTDLRAARRRDDQRKKKIREMEKELDVLTRKVEEAKDECEELGIPLDEDGPMSGRFAEI
ncbi:hypothetical protein HDU93_005092, partial [Gonapodya sp. JEL0774]